MSDNLESLVLEHLRHIRGRVDQIAEEVSEVKHRLPSLELSWVSVKREIWHGDETDARQQISIDKLNERIQRIERRLELT